MEEWAMVPVTAPENSSNQAIYNPNWYAQVKVDGVRVRVTVFDDGDIQILSRNGNNFLQFGWKIPVGWRTPTLKPCVMDGELDRKGETFYPFDLLEVEGSSLVKASHRLRMEMLLDVVPESEHRLVLRTYDPRLVWTGVLTMDGEGMVVKNPLSPYVPGPSRNWLKVKNNKFTSARIVSVEPDKNGLTVIVADPDSGDLYGKVHTTLPDLTPDDTVTIRYCQRYLDGRLREMYLVP